MIPLILASDENSNNTNEKNVSNGNEDWLQAASTAVVLRNKKRCSLE